MEHYHELHVHPLRSVIRRLRWRLRKHGWRI